MAEEYFWGLTLQGGESGSGAWDPENDGGDASRQVGFQGDQTLLIKQAVLGGKAKPGELNIVQVEAMGFNGTVKIPVVRLQAGETPQCRLDLSFPDPPVTFSLLEGNGPVHLVGKIVIGDAGQVAADELDEEMDEEEDENLDEEEINAIQNSKGDNKKRKMPLNPAGKMKKAKLDVSHEAEDEEDEEEDLKKKKGAAAKKDKPKKK